MSLMNSGGEGSRSPAIISGIRTTLGVRQKSTVGLAHEPKDTGSCFEKSLQDLVLWLGA